MLPLRAQFCGVSQRWDSGAVPRAFCAWHHCFPSSSLKGAHWAREAPLSPRPPQSLGNQLKATFFIPQRLPSVFTMWPPWPTASRLSYPIGCSYSGPLQFHCASAPAPQGMGTDTSWRSLPRPETMPSGPCEGFLNKEA